LIRWNLTTGKALWNVSLGGPARCLVFKAPGLILVGCDKDFAVQVWDIAGKQTGKVLKHKGEISGLAVGNGGKLLCSSDRAGYLMFWDAERDEFEPKCQSFTCELMSSGIESISVEGFHLVCSTCEGHVLLFVIDESVGIMPGTAPQRVWKHHQGRVPCVRLLAHGNQDVKVVTASYDNRVFIHPSKMGTALWFSWRPIMNAVRNKEYSLYKMLLLNQEGILHEKVYPLGWTLLHALVDLGDLKAIQILFSIAGREPLGFSLDAEHRSPLDIGLETLQTGILDYLLSEAQFWPKHVLEFSTKALCKLVPMA
jgi:WD40 repeat protein